MPHESLIFDYKRAAWVIVKVKQVIEDKSVIDQFSVVT